jgi:hypothetical protein
MARVNVYIDGLNLYHRKLEGTKYKWLNLKKLAELLVTKYVESATSPPR